MQGVDTVTLRVGLLLVDIQLCHFDNTEINTQAEAPRAGSVIVPMTVTTTTNLSDADLEAVKVCNEG